MKKYAKIVQSDSRGQIVIPKDVRRELNLEEGSGFYIYIIEDEGLFLKKIPIKELHEHRGPVETLKENSSKIKIDKKKIDKSIKKYKRTRKGNFEQV